MATDSPDTETPDYEPRLEVHGEGPLLVYVPGIDGTGRLFYRQVPSLAAAGFTVATFRLRDEAGRMQQLVDDLDDVIARAREAASLPADSAVTLVGESFGGSLGLSYVVANPNHVKRLVILNSFPYFRPQFRLRLGVRALGVVNWKTMSVVRRLTAPFLHSRYTHRDEIRRFLELTDETTLTGYANRLRILMDFDVRERLADVRVPTLFLASDRDHLVPSVRQARLMHSLVPGSDLRVLEGHGHVCLIAPNLDLAEILLEWDPELL